MWRITLDLDAEAVLDKVPARERIGVIDLEDIDLLTGSDANWMHTARGVRFLDARDELVFLWPADETKDPGDLESGLVKVGHISAKGNVTGGWLGNGAQGTLEQAIEAAEIYAARTGQFPSKSAKWRVSNQAASEGQLRFARSLGIDGADAMTKGRLADEITVRLATRRLDG